MPKTYRIPKNLPMATPFSMLYSSPYDLNKEYNLVESLCQVFERRKKLTIRVKWKYVICKIASQNGVFVYTNFKSSNNGGNLNVFLFV